MFAEKNFNNTKLKTTSLRNDNSTVNLIVSLGQDSRSPVFYTPDMSNRINMHTHIYIIKRDISVCLSVCLFVCLYVANGQPNGWADQDQTWHRDSC